MKLVVNPLDPKSIDKAIKQIELYKKKVKTIERRILEELENFGVTRVSYHFGYATMHDTQERPQITSTIKGNTLTISANGRDVAFIEFGAGVRFGHGYKGERPPGIVGIGEYGKGQGNNPNGWWFYDPHTGKPRVSHGNPPAMAMYKTVQELAENIIDIAREEFNK